MRLWELEGGDDGEFGQGFGGGVNGLPLDFEDSEDDEPLPAPGPAQVVPLVPAPRIVPFGPPVRQAPAVRPARARDPGLQRFLRMARDDEEDE